MSEILSEASLSVYWQEVLFLKHSFTQASDVMSLPHFRQPSKAKSHSFYSLNNSCILCFGCIGHSKIEGLCSIVGSHKTEKIKQSSKARCEWDGKPAERTNQRRRGNMEGWQSRRFPVLYSVETSFIFIHVLKLTLENLGSLKQLMIFTGRHRCKRRERLPGMNYPSNIPPWENNLVTKADLTSLGKNLARIDTGLFIVFVFTYMNSHIFCSRILMYLMLGCYSKPHYGVL